MSLRWKFFLILLAVSMTPLVAVTTINHHSNQRLERDLYDISREYLLVEVRRELKSTAESAAALLRREHDIVSAVLGIHAREATRILNTPPGSGEGPSRESSIREGSGPHDDERRMTVYLPPGVERAALSQDIARVLAVEEGIIALRSNIDDIISRIHLTLPSGVHAAFPGDGEYPAGYDPRTRPWYQRALKTEGRTWTFPQVDASSGEVVFVGSRALRDGNGKLLGVAALDVPISLILKKGAAGTPWTGAVKSYVVLNPDETEHDRLLVIAGDDYESPHGAWDEPIDRIWLTSDDRWKFREFIQSLHSSRSGIMEMPFAGEDSIWAHSSLIGNTSFVLVTPKSAVMTMPEQASRTVVAMTKDQRFITGLAALVAIALVAVVAYFGSRGTTRPFYKIVDAWQQVARGDFTARLDYRMGDERDVMVRAFNETVPKLRERFRLRRDLELAQEIQQNLLPASAPLVPGFDLAGASTYCDETGGDYYDFFTVPGDPQRLAVLVGDISGHGLSSALIMSSARGLIRATAQLDAPLGERVRAVNRLLTADTSDSGRFMTLLWVELEPGTGLLRWVRAGHDPPLFFSARDKAMSELLGRGMPLGVSEEASYMETEMRLTTSGDMIVLGTDGIWEARNPAGNHYGKQRFLNLLNDHAHLPAREILETVYASVSAFTEGRHQEDDITLAVLKKL